MSRNGRPDYHRGWSWPRHQLPPELSAARDTVLAAGTGINTNRLKFDVAMESRWGSFRSSQEVSVVHQVGRTEDFSLPPGPEARGSVGSQQWQLKVSLICRVTNTEGSTDFAKKVFGS